MDDLQRKLQQLKQECATLTLNSEQRDRQVSKSSSQDAVDHELLLYLQQYATEAKFALKRFTRLKGGFAAWHSLTLIAQLDRIQEDLEDANSTIATEQEQRIQDLEAAERDLDMLRKRRAREIETLQQDLSASRSEAEALRRRVSEGSSRIADSEHDRLVKEAASFQRDMPRHRTIGDF